MESNNFVRKVEFVTSAAKNDGVPSGLPQIAVSGKSNVGKSSFINFLAGGGKPARVSKTPGRTRLLNCFKFTVAKAIEKKQLPADGGDLLKNGNSLNSAAGKGLTEEFLLVDLPGYGFAKVSAGEQARWAEMVDEYLNNNRELWHVLLLVDIRHDPTDNDLVMCNFLFRKNLPFTIIATKSDKLPKSKVKNQVSHIASLLKVGAGNIIPVSAQEGRGKDLVIERIRQVLECHRPAQEIETE